MSSSISISCLEAKPDHGTTRRPRSEAVSYHAAAEPGSTACTGRVELIASSSSVTLPPPPSEMEAKFYYAGLPSSPPLVARTSTTPWIAPTSPERPRLKELCAVGNHPLKETWEDKLALELHSLLDSMEVKWTSTDVVRIRNVGESRSASPVILWIGVKPASLSGNDGVTVAFKCRKLLVQHGIADVDVEIRESVVTRSAGPKLLKYSYSDPESFDPTIDVREPLTTTLGLPICAQSRTSAEGTSGFFVAEGGNTKRLLLVTARHVVFKPDRNNNTHFKYKTTSQRRHNVMLFGDASFERWLESITVKIECEEEAAQVHEKKIRATEGKGDPEANRVRQEAFQASLDETREAIEKLKAFYRDVLTHWATPESRVLGHVILSPPISVNVGLPEEGYTEDWAVIEVDASKIDASNFDGNAIALGTQISAEEFERMMHPNIQNPHTFTYPNNQLLKLRGTISDKEMRNPEALDEDGEPCIMVIKRGHATGLTIGRANNIVSYSRYYYNDGEEEKSKEWAIFSRDSDSGPFSDKGDSGSVVVDGIGRIGGLITGGSGITSPTDITYATPIDFLLRRMKENGLKSPHINPVLAP